MSLYEDYFAPLGTLIFIGGIGIYAWTSNSKHEPRSERVGGLYNLGNTCFMNSVIQACISLESLIQFLVEHSDEHKPVTVALLGLSHDLQLSRAGKTASTRELTNGLNSRNLFNFSQQDAQEFYVNLSQTLTKENKPKTPLSLFIKEGDLNAIYCGKMISINRNLIVKSPLTGLLASRICCFQCGHTSAWRHDSFDNLSLSIPTQNSSLESLLKNYIEPENIDGYVCEKCSVIATYKQSLLKKNQKAYIEKMMDLHKYDFEMVFETNQPEGVKLLKIEAKTSKQTKIAFAPKCLCLHMQRSVYLASGHLVKNNAAVSFPNLLDLNELVLGTKNHKIFSIPSNVTGYFDKLNADIEGVALSNLGNIGTASADHAEFSSVNDIGTASVDHAEFSAEGIVVGIKSTLTDEIDSKVTQISKGAPKKRKGRKSRNGSEAKSASEKREASPEVVSEAVILDSETASISGSEKKVSELKLKNIQSSVEFPLASKNPTKTNEFPRPFLYHITAVVLHYGHHESGHFITLRKVRKNNRDLWFRISDQDVERIRDIEMDVFRHGAMYAYMVFYERE